MIMKNNLNKKSDYFCVATSFLVSSTLHAVGIPPISITVSSGTGSNIINTVIGGQTIVEYKIQDVIGKAPSKTWVWSSPATPYITRVNSLHSPDCSTYNQPNSNPKSFLLPPSGVCYFALQVDGTQFANTSKTKTATYRPVFSNSDAIEYGPCLSEQIHITLRNMPIITVGSYTSGTTQRPLLAVSHDIGDSWEYPDDITTPVFTPPATFVGKGVFHGASCNSSLCIGVGAGEDSNGIHRPLIALSKDLGITWIYPLLVSAPVFTPDNISFPFPIGASMNTLYSASCNQTLCIAAGEYLNNRRPLLTYSQDLGNTWIYPSSITMPMFTPGNPFPYSSNGHLVSTSCSNSICVAVGGYNEGPGPTNRPLLAQSTDSGNTWIYPASITNPQFITNVFDNFSDLYGVSCSGNTCIAVGRYMSFGDNVYRPLFALTQNAGISWSYPEAPTSPIFQPNDTNPFVNFGTINSVSCIGTTCVAVGSYSDGLTQRPLLASSQDSGSTWSYRETTNAPVFTPTNSYPFDRDGQFNSVSCTSSICIAVGSYVDNTNVEAPLLAQSTDSGITWFYPTSITAPIFEPEDMNVFVDAGRFNSAQCNENICIASGSYIDDSSKQRPLLASSKDKGVTWTFSEAINAVEFTPNNTNPFDSAGQLNAIAGGRGASYLPNSLKFINSPQKSAGWRR